ncbi:MAG: type II toxin-antitoxin system RelE/ParE family toxin [Tunicatimonas sp.]
MNFRVVYTDNFERALKRLARKYRSMRDDLEVLIDSLEEDPIQGTALGKDCYKIRLAIKSKGKGKSGGARIVTHVYVSDQQVYLLTLYDKSEKENISDKELQNLLEHIQ